MVIKFYNRGSFSCKQILISFFCKHQGKKTEVVNDHYWCFKLGEIWFLCAPKIANYESDRLKRM